MFISATSLLCKSLMLRSWGILNFNYIVIQRAVCKANEKIYTVLLLYADRMKKKYEFFQRFKRISPFLLPAGHSTTFLFYFCNA